MYNWLEPTEEASTYQLVLFWWTGGQVKRFHPMPTVGNITTAQHQYTVTWLIWLLTEGRCSARLLMRGLSHDCAECVWGDTPAPAKWESKGALAKQLNKLEHSVLASNGADFVCSPEEEQTLRVADALAGMLEATQERALGNRFMRRPYVTWLEKVEKCKNLSPMDEDVLDAIKKLWAQADK
jgi:5'-deoxynucleotidase YfbR-like HD superfamily hydrolase